MSDLLSFLEATNTKQSVLAVAVGISRGYLSEILGGTKRPSLAVAVGIERATGGAVLATSWVPVVHPSSSQSSPTPTAAPLPPQENEVSDAA